MKFLALVAVLAAGCINVALNICVDNAVKERDLPRYFDSVLSWRFLWAFAVGLGSLLCLLFLYHMKEMNVGRGLLLMGATSIVGGNLFAALVLHRC